MFSVDQLVNVAKMWVGALFLAASPTGRQTEKPFTAVWNSPTHSCETRHGVDIPVTEYGILENTGGVWKGDKMVIFYEGELGLYPSLSKDGVATNGGIPQLADFEGHFAKVQQDIDIVIPDTDFSGYAVIDWENWRPIYSRNWGDMRRYKSASCDLVRDLHPEWSEEKVMDEAEREFETAARTLMEGTLLLAQDMRPKGKWGFYGFPGCYNHQGEPDCSNKTMELNDQLSWLFEASSAIYPSAYIRPTTAVPRHFVHGHNAEALRVRNLYSGPDVPTMLYTRYQLNDGGFYTKEHLDDSMLMSAQQGLDGVIIWGSSLSSNNKQKCEDLKDYFQETFGPYTQQLIDNTEWCSSSLCNSNGRCQKENPLQSKGFPDRVKTIDITDVLRSPAANRVRDVPYRTWRKNVRMYRQLRMLYQEGYTCQCFLGWEGDQCDIPVIF